MLDGSTGFCVAEAAVDFTVVESGRFEFLWLSTDDAFAIEAIDVTAGDSFPTISVFVLTSIAGI